VRGVCIRRKTVDEPQITRDKVNKLVKKRAILLINGNPQGDPNSAPRCGARTRRGTSCMEPAMINGRCRMHGGKSTGPRTPEGLERSRKANWRHGYYSAESIAWRRYISDFFRQCREVRNRVKEDIKSGNLFGYWLYHMGISESEFMEIIEKEKDI
jgi:hypothetical protein